jgi:Gas vesicle protein
VALDPENRRPSQRIYGDALHPQQAPANLADILERVLDKGIVIAGDIQLNLLDIELITLKIRLLIASVDRAREMGINWWESDPSLSAPREERVEFRAEIDRENGDSDLEARIERIEQQLLGTGKGKTGGRQSGGRQTGGRQTGGRQTTSRKTGGATRGPATRPESARRATGSRGASAQK